MGKDYTVAKLERRRRVRAGQHWIPQSQIREDSEVWKEGDESEPGIPEWCAIEKELV